MFGKDECFTACLLDLLLAFSCRTLSYLGHGPDQPNFNMMRIAYTCKRVELVKGSVYMAEWCSQRLPV
ncbi:hypothetical protein M514_07045, partial [Trichuris suis]